MKKILSVVATVLLASAAPLAHAQWVVIDPSNLMQNMLTAARSLEQINNQIRQLQNEAQMLRNDERNLTGLDYSALAGLRASLAAVDRLIDRGQGLAFNVARFEAEFARDYPVAYTAATSDRQMALDVRLRWRHSLEALRTATQVQAQAVENLATDERTLSELVDRSQSAVGALQATQATNQLLALHARQAIQAQQLQITQDRAAALEQARQVAAQERAREVGRRFLGTGTPYTPVRVEFYDR